MGIFSQPKAKQVSAPTPIPQADDEATRRERRRKVAEMQRSSGRESTIMTGRSGDSGSAPTRRSTTLGGTSGA